MTPARIASSWRWLISTPVAVMIVARFAGAAGLWLCIVDRLLLVHSAVGSSRGRRSPRARSRPPSDGARPRCRRRPDRAQRLLLAALTAQLLPEAPHHPPENDEPFRRLGEQTIPLGCRLEYGHVAPCEVPDLRIPDNINTCVG